MLTGFFVLVYLIYRKIKDSASVKWYHWTLVISAPVLIWFLARCDDSAILTGALLFILIGLKLGFKLG